MAPNIKITPILTGSTFASNAFPEAVSQSNIKHIDNDVSEEAWVCPASAKSRRTINPIRAIVDPIVTNSIKSGEARGDGKDPISLALGDPTASGSLPMCRVAIDAVVESVKAPGSAASYIPACGTPEARAAIAKSHSFPGREVSPEQVIIANGCSGALELALTALLDPGTVLLVPKPGFPLYQVIAESHGATVLHYNLLPDQSWECDLENVQELINGLPSEKLRGIVINNPGNPTGSVYSERHLKEILQLAQRNHVPLVADEVYGDLTFGDNAFHPLARVASKLGGHVPIITASGLGKQYLLPGWRVGWVVFHDNENRALRDVEAGTKRLAQVILGASHLSQSVIPALLSPVTFSQERAIADWKVNLRTTLENQATTLCQGLSTCHGLTVLMPQGAMYAMVEIDLTKFDSSIQDDVVFTKLLLEEENVFVLPGRAFNVRRSACIFRVVYCASESILVEASKRIHDFCERHAAKN